MIYLVYQAWWHIFRAKVGQQLGHRAVSLSLSFTVCCHLWNDSVLSFQVSELIRQNKPVYAIDTADTETHFKRCGNDSIEWLNHIVSIFSSPEPKAQVSFSDQNLSVVLCCCCRRCRCCCRKLFTFHRTTGPVSTKFAQSIPGWRWFSLFKWRAPPFSKGR